MVRFHTGSATIDEELNILKADDRFREFLGKEVPGNLKECLLPEDLDTVREAVGDTLVDKKSMFCCRIRRNTGAGWVIMQTTLGTDRYGNSVLELSMQDVSEFDDNQEVARDVTTGLLPKEEIIHAAHQMLLNPPPNGVYMCIVDVDNFKGINDSYGHLTGDMVLRTVSDIISGVIEGKGLAGRIGGDEIMLILNHIMDREELRVVLKEIRVGIETQFKDAPTAKGVTVSIGAVLYPTFAQNYDDSFKIADKMLYRAKDKGKNRYIIYTPEIHGDVLNSGDGVAPGEVKVRNAGYDRHQLMYQLLEKFVAHAAWSIEVALINTGNTFDLDGISVFNQEFSKSFCAYERIRKEEGHKDEWRLVTDSMPFGADPDFLALFNRFHVLQVDNAEALKHCEPLRRYLEEKEILHGMIYHMTTEGREGFVLFYSKGSRSSKLSVSDEKDLSYIGRMVEIALGER